MQRIDCHMHLQLNGFTAQGIIDYLDGHRLDKCWLLTWEEDSPLTANYNHLSIEDVFEAYERYPDRIIPMYAPDPSRENAVKDLEQWYRKGIRGIAELKVRQNWDDYAVEKILKTAQRFSLPVLFHMQGGRIVYRPVTGKAIERLFCIALSTGRYRKFTGRSVRYFSRFFPLLKRYLAKTRTELPGYMLDFHSLERRLDQFKDVIFIGHGPLFWKGISKELGPISYPKGKVREGGITSSLLSDKDNLYADLSGGSGYNALSRDTTHAKKFLSRHYKKILFGTDNGSIDRRLNLLDSLVSVSEQKRRIMGGNAQSIIERIKL